MTEHARDTDIRNSDESIQQAGEAISAGWFQFVSDRLAKDAAFPQQLAACKTADDVYVAYSEFWQQAARDYAVEFKSIADQVWRGVH